MLNMVSESNFQLQLSKNYLNLLEDQAGTSCVKIEKEREKINSSLQSFRKSLPQYKRTLLICIKNNNNELKNLIVTLENPVKDFVKHTRNNELFYQELKNNIFKGAYTQVSVTVCKEQL